MTTEPGKVGKLVAAFRQGGLRQVRRVVNTHLLTRETRQLEAAYDADLVTSVDLDEVEVIGENRQHGFFYGATPVRCLHTLIANLPGELQDYTLIDFGSGKGVALLLGGEYPFRRVIGVEFGKELHEIACRNIEQCQGPRRRCSDVTSHLGDATQFELPAEPCAVVLGNPFAEPVMQRVVANLGEAHRRHGQPIFVLYQQLKVEDDISRADTQRIFRESGILRERPLHFPTLRDRLLLSHLKLGIYEVVT